MPMSRRCLNLMPTTINIMGNLKPEKELLPGSTLLRLDLFPFYQIN